MVLDLFLRSFLLEVHRRRVSPGHGRVWILSNRYGNNFYLLTPVDSLFSVNSR